MNKEQIDKYFTDNWQDIQSVVKRNAPKCSTINRDDISTDIYLICIEKAEKIENLPAFIRIVSSNIYRWSNSDFNKENKILATDLEDFDTYIQEDNDFSDDRIQDLEYRLEKYLLEATLSEKVFYQIYVNEGIRSERKLEKRLGVSRHGARTLVSDFKEKLKGYER